jgi:hypothetical protein
VATYLVTLTASAKAFYDTMLGISQGNTQLVLHLDKVLTVTNYYYKPSMKHEKGHISTSKHRIRV